MMEIHDEMDAQFTTMDSSNSSTYTSFHSIFHKVDVRNLDEVRMMMWDAYSITSNKVVSWSNTIVGQCFRNARRQQFDKDQQQSLLSCHDDEMRQHEEQSEAALLELRRRMEQVNIGRNYQPTYGKYVDYTNSLHDHSDISVRMDHIKKSTSNLVASDYKPAYNSHNVGDLLNSQSPLSYTYNELSQPEEEKETTLDQNNISIIQNWLKTIDPMHCDLYTKYAELFVKQGFCTIDDLAELDETDVEQAMSEIGIIKFAHRARIRNAILRLPPSKTKKRSDTTASTHSTVIIDCEDNNY